MLARDDRRPDGTIMTRPKTPQPQSADAREQTGRTYDPSSAPPNPGNPVPGVQVRRHNAVRAALEERGWRPHGAALGGTRLYHHPERPEAGLLVGTGGALYWTRPGTDDIMRQARTSHDETVAAALAAARATN